MRFKHNLVEIPQIKQINGVRRYYETPTGIRYPSVTTILSATADKSHLDKWRDRVGHDEANRITKQAGMRGTATHSLCEDYVLNRELNFSSATPLGIDLFKQIQPVLDNNVDNIRLSEGALFSHKLRTAGSVDLVAEYNGIPSIIDFKTSRRAKRTEWITDYYLQTAMYAYMLWELTKIHCGQLVVIIALEDDNRAQVFIESTNKWIDQAYSRCNQYHQENPL